MNSGRPGSLYLRNLTSRSCKEHDHDQRFDHTHERHRPIRRSQRNLYYETHGSGRPLILLHGGLGSGEMFGPVLPLLAERHQVIGVNLQGHDRTSDIDRPMDIRLMAGDIAVALLASACASSASPTAARATPQTMPSRAQDLKAGTYAYHFQQLDLSGKPFPKVLITVPDGWSAYRDFFVHSLVGTQREIAVSFWNVVDVYTNGCHWLGPMIHPGPTVDGLAAVLAARPLRNATAPVAVSLGEFHGKFLQWSVPADINFSDCDQEPSDGVRYFDSWTGASLSGSGTTDRYQQEPGQVDRLWIIDVEGRRLVIDAAYWPGATDQDRANLQRVVDSIAFER